MYSEPNDLDRGDLADALRRHWGIEPERLEYVPVGFGSHHWEVVSADGQRWFVSADDLGRPGYKLDSVFASLGQAFATAVMLRDAGLEFVLAPITAADGAALERIGSRYAVHVERFVDGTAGEDGEFEFIDDRRAAATLVGRLHAESDGVLARLTGRREDFALLGRRELEVALVELDLPWGPGPYADPARELLRRNADDVRQRLWRYEQITSRALADQTDWVITHGEPHSANLIHGQAGGLWLVDWATALIGPRERDLWMVLDTDANGWDEYRAVTGAAQPNGELLALYRERWALAEICEYVALFKQPHTDTKDAQLAWAELGEYLV